MLRGALVCNRFLRSGKFAEHYAWLKEAAERQGMALSLFDNTKLCRVLGEEGDFIVTGGKSRSETGEGKPESRRMDVWYQEWDWLDSMDFVIFWDKDIPGGKFLEIVCRERGIGMFNAVDAIACCDHKFLTYEKIWEWNRRQKDEAQITLIPTVMAPMTYENIGYANLEFVEDVLERLGLPLIVKECYGSFGMQVYKADTREEVRILTKKLQGKPILYQKYLDHTAGNDVRIQVVGGRAVAAMHRFSETGDFRANLTNGGSMEPYHPSEEERRIAVQVCAVLGLDFGGVDLLFDREGKATILCEVNSNAHFRNIFDCTGVNVAECIVEHIRRKVEAGCRERG